MSDRIEVLFVGDNWLGSSARGLREALVRRHDVVIDDIAPDSFRPHYRSLILRASNRLLKPWQTAELRERVISTARLLPADVVLFYKGDGFDAEFLGQLKMLGSRVVNIFPDCSPHLHGQELRDAMGAYDLVISTKPYHPGVWLSVYGYSNSCVFVPHGYDRSIHFFERPAPDQDIDIVIAANGRPEYYELMLGLARQRRIASMRVLIAGPNWAFLGSRLPNRWMLTGPIIGLGYAELVRRAKVVIAPVQTKIATPEGPQPGDMDSTRTYELAAAFTFFIHRRTPYIESIYDPDSEVPTYEGADELGELLAKFVTARDRRLAMSAAAHRRAVPAYSLDARAEEVVGHLKLLYTR